MPGLYTLQLELMRRRRGRPFVLDALVGGMLGAAGAVLLIWLL